MMHQQGSGPHYSSSGGQHYQGQQTIGMMGQSNQGNSMVPQRPVGSYRPAQQGKSDVIPVRTGGIGSVRWKCLVPVLIA